MKRETIQAGSWPGSRGHPSDDDLLRFVLGTTSRPENRTIVRHLLARCPACAAVLKRVKPEPPVEPADYNEALDRLAARLRELGGGSGGGLRAPTPSSGGAFPRRVSG
jgi:hypothetical protein